MQIEVFFELKEICFGEDYVLDKEETDTLIQNLLNGYFHGTDKEECKHDEVRICLHSVDDANDEEQGYYWVKFKAKGMD